MVAECDRVAADLRKAIDSSKVRSDARSKTLESGRVYTKSALRSKNIKELRSRLDDLDQ
ncbi:hypothetical protein BJX64DRAFT_246920, partial [Aspergillus heterothallicus]